MKQSDAFERISSSVSGSLTPTKSRPVTIAVPIYGDLPSLMACVESIKQNVDLESNSVLLVNDCGPEADVIESHLRTWIAGSAIRYERNRTNIGFLRTCNRVATELDTTENDILFLNSDTVTTVGFLDELSAVLHLSPLHGAVCARSNNADIASFPSSLRDPAYPCTFDRAAELHAALSGSIRRYSISHVAHGFCFLVRRELIKRYGLFDEAFAPAYFEEYDFCLRMNALGFASVLANRAMVFHMGDRSLREVPKKKSIFSTNYKKFFFRYPFYWIANDSYMFHDRDPVDLFADTLVPADQILRVLVDLNEIPSDGLPICTLGLIGALQKASDPSRFLVSLSVPDNWHDKVAKTYPALRVFRHSHLHQLWDVAIASCDTLSRTQLFRLNRISPRWIFTSSGIDEVRNWRKRAANPSGAALVQDAIRYADGIVAMRGGVTAELESYVGTIGRNFPAFALVQCNAAKEVIVDLAEVVGRSTINIDQLRTRWEYFARLHSHERAPFARRLLRRAETASPRLVSYARSVVRVVNRSVTG